MTPQSQSLARYHWHRLWRSGVMAPTGACVWLRSRYGAESVDSLTDLQCRELVADVEAILGASAGP